MPEAAGRVAVLLVEVAERVMEHRVRLLPLRARAPDSLFEHGAAFPETADREVVEGEFQNRIGLAREQAPQFALRAFGLGVVAARALNLVLLGAIGRAAGLG